MGESTEDTREMADEVNDGTSGQAKMEDWEEMDLIGFSCLSFGLPALESSNFGGIKRDQRGALVFFIGLSRKCFSLRYHISGLRFGSKVGGSRTRS